MPYCFDCGSRLKRGIPPTDDRVRLYCGECGYIHYVNPKILVAVVLYCEDKLFWGKRGIEPAKGKWTFPSGFVETGETLQQAAARELYEETNIRLKDRDLLLMSIGSVVSIDQIYISFRCHMKTCESAQITQETQDWGWFDRDSAPWDGMAYPELKPNFEEIYQWVEEGTFSIRIGESNLSGHYQQFPLKK